MAKQIIILTASKGPGGDTNVTAAFWFAVTAGHQVPNPTAQSAFRGASAAEAAALVSGATVEQFFTAQYPSAFTAAQIEAALVAAYTTANTTFQAQPNPNQFYGIFYDGTLWNASAGVPPGQTTSGEQFGTATFSTTGDHTTIAGISGQAIAVDQLIISANGAVTVLVKDGATTIGAFQFPTGGGSYSLPNTGKPWFLTSIGNGWVLNLGAAVSVIVTGWFRQG